MKSICDSVSYTSRYYKETIAKLTEPLKKFIQVDAFWQYSITHDGFFSTISNKPEQLEFFWDEMLFLGHPYLRRADFYPSGYHFPHLIANSDYERTQGKMRENEFLDQMIILFRQNKNGLSAYCFAPRIKINITDKLINSLPLLNRYIDYFNEETDKIIKMSLARSIDLKEVSNEYFNTSPKIADQMLSKKNEKEFLLALESDTRKAEIINSFTEREKSCLYWFLKGRSASEIAKKLFLSPRTIEYYLDNIKNKCGVSKKSDLFDFLADWGLYFKQVLGFPVFYTVKK